MKMSRLARALTVGAALSLSGLPAGAETLTDTLISAYQQSPVLESERARLRSTDEQVALARSNRRPTINATASADVGASGNTDFELTDEYSLALRSSLLLYDNGQTAAAIEAAKALVAAARGQLRQVEQQVLLNAVVAYMDIRRDIQSVNVAENNVEVLRQQVQATRDRFELGEVTRTDVSLAEARLASAQANLASLRGRLQSSRESYRAVVGQAPGTLQAPPPIPPLPGSLNEAEGIAIATHPSLTAARYAETAAQFDVTRARAARGPSLSADASVAYTDQETSFGRDQNHSFGVGVTGTLPIYKGGQLSALVRQAEAQLAQRKYDVQDVARTIRQNAATAWSNLQVARASITANRQQVEAARVAFEGVREEATLGARTTLDVLNLEQDLRDAQLQLAGSIRDEYVAAYQLLSAMGLLSVEHLQLGIPTYDPDINYLKVQGGPYSTVEGGIMEKLRDRYSR